MASITDLLRRRDEDKRKIAELHMNRCREQAAETAERIINSDSFKLTVLNQVDSSISAEERKAKVNELVDAVVTKGIEAVMDPVENFVSVCQSRHMSEDDIKTAVRQVCELFGLANPTDSYEKKLKEVAIFMNEHQDLYGELMLFKG